MKREPGYYWVKQGGEWTVAEWYVYNGHGSWLTPGFEEDEPDESLQQIDENRIICPHE